MEQLIQQFRLLGIDSDFTIVNQEDFKSTIESLQFDEDVHLVLGYDGLNYSYEFLYKDGFFNYPTSKINKAGEQISFEYSIDEVEFIRNEYITTAINDNESIGELTKREEQPLNIFERGMWVIKTTRDVLDSVKVPEPLWNKNHDSSYPFQLNAFISGLGDGAIDELKSIPDLLLLSLTLFNKEERNAIWSAISQIDIKAVGKMFQEKGNKYDVGGDVAWHEGGYDVVQIASLFYGGGLVKGARKSSELAGGLMKVLDDLPTTVRKKLDNFTKEQRDALLRDLSESDELLQAFQQADLVDAWKVIEGNPILRKKPENLENISKWLDEGIEPQKLADGIAKSPSKQKLIDELGAAKSKLHARVLIKDYDNIPGVVKGRYTPNGSTIADKAQLSNSWDDDFDLPVGEVENFTGKIEPLELKPGERIYRVSGDDGVSGPYWTKTKPEKLEDVIGGIAVKPAWNNFEYISEYVVPEGVIIKSWVGKTASQRVGNVPSNYYLPGGDEQLFISFIKNQDSNFSNAVKTIKTEW